MNEFRLSRTVLVFLAVLAGSSSANSVEETVKGANPLEQLDPDTLGYFAFADEVCEFDTDDIKEIVEGVMIRSRIKPASDFAFLNLYLAVEASCLDVEMGGKNVGQAVDLAVEFGQFNPKPALIYDSYDFGTLILSTSKEFSLGAVKDRVEAAVTEYLQANFDLEPE